jgi:2-oxoglutarate ferredoxin oxidoreductase subunit beta
MRMSSHALLNSPTTPKTTATKSTPEGNIETPINPLALALVSGATFIGRGYSGEINHLTDLIAQAIEHKGFALVDVFSPCVTYMNMYQFFKPRVYNVNETEYDSSDWHKAMPKTYEWGEKIPLGARILAVADAYDELVSGIGSPAVSVDRALEILSVERIAEFDPVVIGALFLLEPQNNPVSS